ncbi:MAG TPA: DUF4190 domain-containing protein [Verrucomicrobiae bacterium]
MKYRIVGADGQTYGPIGVEQLRQWIAQGRADSRTPVFAEGAAAWTTLGALPEFAADFAAPPQRIGALPPVAGAGGRTNGFATAGLIFGLLAWTCCCCVPFALLGLIFSIIALVQINGQPVPQEGKAFAVVGLVLSGTNLLVSLGAGLVQLVLAPANMSWNFGHM